MDSVAREPVPCPNCGSRNVRWRNRRPYDVLLTWARYFADTVLSVIFTRGAQPALGYGSDHHARSEIFALRYRRQRAAYEASVGLTTADRFWRCPDCKQRGQVFCGLDTQLTSLRADLASTEDRIVGDLGSVSNPVDRDGLHRD